MPPAVNFLSDCEQQRTQNKVFTSFDDAIMYPWVEAWIPGEKLRVSMGNRSARTNEAHIKSFNFGLSNGLGVKMEVVDEAGGNFFKFFQRLNNSNTARTDRMMRFRWGYMSQNCDGFVNSYTGYGQTPASLDCATSNENTKSAGLPLPNPGVVRHVSSEHTLFIQDIECQASTASCFKFIVNALDMMVPVTSSVDNRTFGSDDNPVPITEAIRDLFAPYNIQVDFVEIDASGNRRPLQFTPIAGSCTTQLLPFAGDVPILTEEAARREKNQLYCGPCGVWRCSNRRPLFIAREWLNSVKTLDRRGIISFWEDVPNGHKLVFCKSNRDPCGKFNPSMILGTYIVNGGKCYSGNSGVFTEDGWRQIHNIYRHKYAGKVRCVDEHGNLTWGAINNWYRTRLGARKLLKVHLHHSRQRAGSISGAICTDDHPVLTDSGYVEAGKLDVCKHLIHSGTECPSDIVHQAVVGTLLGDSHVRRNSFAYDCAHGPKQAEYLRHKAQILGLSDRIKPKKNGITKVSSVASPYWRQWRKRLYPDGIKRVTKDVLKDFSIVSLAYLFMDDGSLSKKLFAEIATCCFPREEVELLRDAICELGIECYLRPNDVKNRLYFTAAETKKLSRLISPYIIPCMEYKLLPKDRGGPKTMVECGKRPFFDTFDIIRCVELEKKTKWVYCIGVEKHNNFVTHSGVAHNCSPVLTFQPNFKFMFQQTMTGATRPVGGAEGPARGVGQLDGGLNPDCATPSVMTNLYRSGISAMQSMNPNISTWFLGDAAEWALDANIVNNYANIFFNTIDAELKIQGNPAYEWPFICNGYGLTIIYINPFRPKDAGPDYVEWMQGQPPGLALTADSINQILSNCNWMIMGMSHDIRDGTYHTTLKLKLLAPGIDLPPGAGLGNCPGAFNWGHPAPTAPAPFVSALFGL